MRLARRLPRHFLALSFALVAGCAEVALQQGCNADDLKVQPADPASADEVSCVQFSIDATQEPGTFHAPTVLSAFPFDPANQYRLSTVSTSVDWRDGRCARRRARSITARRPMARSSDPTRSARSPASPTTGRGTTATIPAACRSASARSGEDLEGAARRRALLPRRRSCVTGRRAPPARTRRRPCTVGSRY